ncbi:MAG: DUF4886 domain-containing protein [Bacteroidales bacterium]|nr:DUF4886 domain-containing protein [Bacteroidales bacterium]
MRPFLTAAAALLLLFSCNKNTLPAPPDIPQKTDPETELPELNKESIKILAIGNSFSVDAMQYLYPMLKELGFKEIVLGNLYIGSCSLETHTSHITSGAGAYTYYINTSDSWSNSTGNSSVDVLKSQDWDLISMQQASAVSGVPSSYEPFLTTLIAEVGKHCPGARLMWHQTWAYQSNSTSSAFPTYGKDQEKMYLAIMDASHKALENHPELKILLPSGTAVQNLRSSFVGDDITRDGHHLSYNIGRFLAGMTWLKAITGCDLRKMEYRPSSYKYSDRLYSAMAEAVEKACEKPFVQSRSSYEADFPVTTPNEALRKIATDAGYDLSKYDETALNLVHNAYWESTTSSNLISSDCSDKANLPKFTATRMFGKSDLPNGSLIVLKSGFQYRPDGWTALGTKTSSRPAVVKTQIVEVNPTWWGSWIERGFNLAKDGSPELDAAGQKELESCFAIFVPKEVVDDSQFSCEQIFTSNGYSLDKYEKLNLALTPYAYWESQTSVNMITRDNSTSSNLKKFTATPKFTKADLPIGSVIVLKSGFQYRPDGWTVIDQVRGSGVTRPAVVKTRLVVVDETWWGNWVARGFNLAKDGNPALDDAGQAELQDCFAIYVPRK